MKLNGIKRNRKIQTETRVLDLSMFGSVLFMLAEGIMAYITHSHSILMDCIFDAADLIMLGPFLVLIPLLYKPVTEKRPYGFSQVESLFLLIKYGVLLALTVSLMGENIELILEGGHLVNAGMIAVFEFVVFLCCAFMYIILSYFSRRYSSVTIKAELYIWKLDIIGSLGVAVAFVMQYAVRNTSIAWIASYVDPFVAIIMSVILCVEPVKVIFISIKKLVLFAPPQEVMNQIREIVEDNMQKYTYKVRFLDVIQTGRKTWVEVYIGSKDDNISIGNLYVARNDIRKQLADKFDQIYVELIPELPD